MTRETLYLHSPLKKEPCQKCGKRGRFPCPALNGPICSYCCGSGRGSIIDCDPLCARYPFGTENYDGWLQIEATWPIKMGNRLVADIGARELERRIKAFKPSSRADEMSALEGGFYTCLIHGMFYEKVGENGETRAESWERDGWAGLNNDERVMTRYRRHTYLTVIELQGVTREGLASECIDLLDPARGSFTVYDRSVASQAVPYTRVLSWLTHFPHYSRTGGVAISLEQDVADDFIAEVRKRADSRDAKQVYAYLIDHYLEIVALTEEMANRHREEMITSLDARWHTTTFRVSSFPMLEAKLGAQREILPGYADECDAVDWPGQLQCYDWVRHGRFTDAPHACIQRHLARPEGEPGPEVLATLRLFPDRLIAETVGTALSLYIRNQLNALFGDLLVFDREKIDDHGQRMLQREGKAPVKNSPAPQEEISDADLARISEAFMQKTYRDLLDSPVPALDNLSPREAAARPEMAECLADWAKGHIHNIAEHRARKGGNFDLAWFFEELGIAHLWRA